MRIILWLYLLFYLTTGFSQTIYKHITNLGPDQYGDNLSEQTWSVTQIKGKYYFGNAYHIIEYDGEWFRNIKIPTKGTYVTALSTDTSGVVYWGASGMFGLLAPNKQGYLQAIVLSDSLDAENKSFGIVWKSFRTKHGMVFFSQEKIFILNNNNLKVIKPETSFHLAFNVNNELWVRQRGVGLMRYNGESLVKLKGSEIPFAEYGVFGIIDSLIITQELGLFKYKLKKDSIFFSKLETPIHSELINSIILGAQKLQSGEIALNTALNGILIINSPYKSLKQINKESGMAGNDIKNIIEDKARAVWAVGNSGISKINYGSPLSFFKNEQFNFGKIQEVVSCCNYVFFRTEKGLFAYHKQNTTFKKIEPFGIAINSISEFDNKLLIATSNGIFVTDNALKTAKVLSNSPALIKYHSKTNSIYTIGFSGLNIYDKSWNLINSYPELFIEKPIKMEITEMSNNNSRIWIGTINEGLFRIDIDTGSFSEYNYTVDSQVGIEEGWIKPVQINNQIYFAGITGLLSFKEDDKDSFFNFDEKYSNATLSKAVTIMEENNTETYICLDNQLGTIGNSGFNNKAFSTLNHGSINALAFDSNNIWIGSDKALIQYNRNHLYSYKKRVEVSLRNIIIGQDSVIYAGEGLMQNNGSTIEYINNNVSFKFASSNKYNGIAPQYAFYLENYEDSLSSYSKKNYVNYRKLPPGNYTFKVKVKDVYGNESSFESYHIEILPPWYLTPWAYFLYLILLVIIVYGIVKLSMHRLKNQNIRLENIVNERTEEIRNKNIEITKNRDQLARQHREIEDSINYAGRIQTAVLPDEEFLSKIPFDYFVLLKPKDIVSGDFYWSRIVKNHLIVTVADCTGHGVPGAFMSMLGVSFLNEIVVKEEITKASEVLNELRKYVIAALKQKGESGEQKDGMDMTLCAIDMETLQCQYAGANNSLYIIRDKQEEVLSPKSETFNNLVLYDIKCDKMPIAIYEKMDAFTNYEINLKQGDTLFMYSDGYADQFGGPKGKKYKYKTFKQYLLKNALLSAKDQKEKLNANIEKWMNQEHETYEQIDDICIMGIKI